MGGAALTRPAATLSHRMGEGWGEGLNFPEIVDITLWGAHAPRVSWLAPSPNTLARRSHQGRVVSVVYFLGVRAEATFE